MRLKSLEIKGFKSFGNPTTLYFDENVTGVVGPNGSGKSNVVDAFRWVLGEQKSKELRLEQMGDVLFNGAENKQQANMAEVSVTFDNTKNILPTDYNTVKITRALYRSGESEYRINDIACRLKDIHSLLMDTGIGSNSYSIIELGMVDDILQDKENARRRMFEQAAGISKFKKRKKETLQKLKLTNADLERIEDLLFEIETNLKDLEKQAKRTKRYFEIKEKYKEASIQFHKLKWDRLESGMVSINSQIGEHTAEFNKWSGELAKKEAVLEEEKRKNLQGEKDLSKFQKQLNELLDEIRMAENEKNLLSQKIQFSQKNIEKATEEIVSAEPRLAESMLKIESLNNEIEKQRKVYILENEALGKFEQEVDQVNQEFQSNKAFQQDKMKSLQDIQGQIFEIDKTLAVAENRKETYQNEIIQNSGVIERTEGALKGKEEDLDQFRQKLVLIESEIEVLTEKEQHRIQRLEQLEREISSKKDAISKLNRNIDAITNERNLLQSMVENLEGFSESVKFLYKNWEGKKTLLSDIINTEDKYRAAAEQVLHPYLNYYIVENIEEAQAAISLLQNAQKGKVQFFLLDQISPSLINETKLFKSLASVIETEEKFRPLINLICGHVYICSEDQIYSNKYKHLNLIEEKGSIWRTGNQLTGGSVGLFEGKKIGRKKRIEFLDKTVAKEKAKIDNERNSLGKLTEQWKEEKAANYQVLIKAQEQGKVSTEKEMMLLTSNLENGRSKISDLKHKIDQINAEQKTLEALIGGYRDSKEVLISKIDTYQSDVTKQDAHISELSEKLSGVRENYNAQNIKLIQAENQLNNLKTELHFQQQQLKEVKQNLSEAKQLKERQESELEKALKELKSLSEFLQEKYQNKSREQDYLTKAEEQYYKARAIANEVEDEIRRIAKNINDKQYLINQLKDKLNDYKFKKNSIKERLSIEFQYKISDLFEVSLLEDADAATLELNVEKYRRRLDNYGDINPMALEAYDEMEKRFIHITEQRDDINKAKISLMDTISEIEETATALFLDSFNEVRKHFVVVFRSLFTQDDDCDLLLEDPNDPLNSRIEIIAKPKGKRPISLSQLSGGEKTLTATALLFSLYLLKPAPFCIFDEVDAPLDDTNIQKFANIIRAFSDKSQFVIVTHNKATMAEVDVLYGVFMQKKGISSVSAVDFRSYENKGTMATKSMQTY